MAISSCGFNNTLLHFILIEINYYVFWWRDYSSYHLMFASEIFMNVFSELYLLGRMEIIFFSSHALIFLVPECLCYFKRRLKHFSIYKMIWVLIKVICTYAYIQLPTHLHLLVKKLVSPSKIKKGTLIFKKIIEYRQHWEVSYDGFGYLRLITF